jgi:hypothetical protein
MSQAQDTAAHDADVLLGRLFPVPPTDAATIRALVRLRKKLGWTIRVYGDDGGHQHCYREPEISPVFGSKVVVECDRITYRRRGDDIRPARAFYLVRPESVAEVHGWLVAVGLVPAAVGAR